MTEQHNQDQDGNHQSTGSSNQSSQSIKIDKATLVPIGLGITVVLSAVSMATWLQGSILGIRHDNEKSIMTITNEIAKTQNKIDEVSIQISGLAKVTWTFEDMKAFARLLQAENPALKVPDIVRSH